MWWEEKPNLITIVQYSAVKFLFQMLWTETHHVTRETVKWITTITSSQNFQCQVKVKQNFEMKLHKLQEQKKCIFQSSTAL